MLIGIGNRVQVSYYHSEVTMERLMDQERSYEGELLMCDQGLFRVVNGRRCFVDPSEETVERLRLDAAADSKGRSRRKSWSGVRCI